MGAMTASLLDRPIYGIRQVDALLGLPPGTARRWIDGYHRGGRSYPPVVRPESTGEEIVTWGEFVETRLLAAYRAKGVPLQRMRPVIDRLREQLGVKYPLAHARPFAQDRELVLEVQEIVDLDERLFIVEVLRNGQLRLAQGSQRFWDSIDWGLPHPEGTGDKIATRLHLVRPDSPVVLDPLRCFGAPSVGSVRTDVIAEEVRAGSPLTFVASSFEITLEQAAAAVEYEERTAA